MGLKDFFQEKATSTGHVAYHYTHINNLTNILKEGLKPKGLLVRRENIVPNREYPPLADHEYIFSFLDSPKPDEWIKNQEFPNMYPYLMKRSGGKENLIVISFPILTSDKANVVDFAVYLRNCDRTGFISLEGNKRYCLSGVPLTEYKGDYSLPELIIANPISSSRLRINQP